MKSVKQEAKFLRDIKRMKKRGKDIEKLKAVVLHLQAGLPLEARCRDHAMMGEWIP